METYYVSLKILNGVLSKYLLIEIVSYSFSTD
jgi:hypothetical protein